MAELHAWVDESGSDRTCDPHTYMLAAAVVSADAMDAVRSVVAPLRFRGRPKLHWRDENKHERRMLIAETVAGVVELEHLVVVRAGISSDSNARPRAVTMKRLLRELDDRGVRRAVFESRGPADDQRDRELLRKLRDKQQYVSSGLKMDHAPGRSDPGLWVPDTLCGVVSASRGGQSAYLEVFTERITVVNIDHAGNDLA